MFKFSVYLRHTILTIFTLILCSYIFILTSCMELRLPKSTNFQKAVCHDLAWDQDFEIDVVIKKMKEARVERIRLPVRWSMFESVQGEYNWSKLDTIIQKLADNGIQITAQFLSVPSWANGIVQNPLAPNDWADCYPPIDAGVFIRSLTAVVSRYKHTIREWIIFNEVNLNYFWKPRVNPSEYVLFLKHAYAAVKSIDPSILVIAGSLAGNGVEATEHYGNFLDAMYKNGAKGYYDVLSIHPYTHPSMGIGELQRKINQTKQAMAVAEDTAELWIDEIGWSISPFAWNNPTVTDAQAAEWLINVYTQISGIERIYWYCFRNKGINFFDPEHNFGLVDLFLIPKKTFYAFQSLY